MGSMKNSDTWMSRFRRLLILAIITILFGVAARLALTRSSAPAAPATTMPTSTPTDTATPAPTKTSFIFPTAADTRTPTLTAVPPSRTPTSTPSATPVPPSPTPSATKTLTPALAISDSVTALTYTVVISDVYGRHAPYLESSQYQRLKLGQSCTVTAQSSNGIWLQLEVPKSNQLVWVPAAFGLIYGNRDAAPLVGPTLTPTHTPISTTSALTATAAVYPYLSPVSARARDIYRYGLLLGNNPHAFIKIGDCQATYPYFLAPFDSPKNYRLGDEYAYLKEAIAQFKGSFARDSVAAQTGFGTATVLDPQWANPDVCRPGESPLVCEYRAMRPSLAIISLGTNDIWQPDGSHEKHMREIIDYLVGHGVLPILSTKADNVEGDGSFNRLMVQLANENQLPLWDYWQVTRPLPEHGLTDTYHLSWGPAIFDDPKNMLLGWPWRNLTALQALDAVWRAVR